MRRKDRDAERDRFPPDRAAPGANRRPGPAGRHSLRGTPLMHSAAGVPGRVGSGGSMRPSPLAAFSATGSRGDKRGTDRGWCWRGERSGCILRTADRPFPSLSGGACSYHAPTAQEEN